MATREQIEEALANKYLNQYVQQFSQEFISRAFSSIKASARKTLNKLSVPETDDNMVKLLTAVSTAIKQGTDWEPPQALVKVAETKARIQYNSQVKNLLDDLEV